VLPAIRRQLERKEFGGGEGARIEGSREDARKGLKKLGKGW